MKNNEPKRTQKEQNLQTIFSSLRPSRPLRLKIRVKPGQAQSSPVKAAQSKNEAFYMFHSATA